MLFYLLCLGQAGGIDPQPFIGEWELYTADNLNTSIYTIELHFTDSSKQTVSGSLWHDGILFPDLSSKAKNPIQIINLDFEL